MNQETEKELVTPEWVRFVLSCIPDQECHRRN